MEPKILNLRVTDLDTAISKIDDIIQWAIQNESRIGYFAALYRKVTIKIRDLVEADHFERSDRIRDIGLVYINRYFDEIEAFRQNRKITESWAVSFKAAQSWTPVVMQHLLLGMNAHINIDLGIAVGTIVPKEDLEGFIKDFDSLNEVLGSMVDDVEKEIAQIWPLLGMIDPLLGNIDEGLIRFSIKNARKWAWKVAGELAAADKSQWDSKIAEFDRKIARLGNLVLNPGFYLSMLLLLARIGETGTMKKKILILY